MMANNKNTLKTFNSEKEGIRIIKVAAFCFAIMSWIATAQGLHAYVFDFMWQALLISFGIQGILFVFNLKLPAYFAQIGESVPDNQKTHRKWYFGKNKGKEKHTFRFTSMQRIIALFYAVVLLASSIFSFVYICNTVVYTRSTGYVDANIIIDSNYRRIIDEADKYISENTKAMQVLASKRLSELQLEMKPVSASTMERNLDELLEDESVAKRAYQNAESDCDTAQDNYNMAYAVFSQPFGERWRPAAEYEAERTAVQTASVALNVAKNVKNEKEQAYTNAQSAVNNYKPSQTTIVHDFLSEMLRPDPDQKVLDKDMKALNDIVIQMGKSDSISTNFNDIVQKTQSLNIVIEQFIALKSANNSIGDYKRSIADVVIIPNPKSNDFLSQKQIWESIWHNKLITLENLIKTLPTYSTTNNSYLDDEIVDIALLQSFNSKQIINEIDNLIRNHLSDMNVIERAVNLLFGRYPFAAWVSLVLALFLDIASLLAGLFLYVISKEKIDTKGSVVLQIHTSTSAEK